MRKLAVSLFLYRPSSRRYGGWFSVAEPTKFPPDSLSKSLCNRGPAGAGSEWDLEENRWFSAVRGSSAANRWSRTIETIQKLHFRACKCVAGHPGVSRSENPIKIGRFWQISEKRQILEIPSSNNLWPHCSCFCKILMNFEQDWRFC